MGGAVGMTFGGGIGVVVVYVAMAIYVVAVV